MLNDSCFKLGTLQVQKKALNTEQLSGWEGWFTPVARFHTLTSRCELKSEPPAAPNSTVSQRALHCLVKTFVSLLLLTALTNAQTPDSARRVDGAASDSTTRQKSGNAVDRNKFAIIISGASGEATYEKQFSGWTTNLVAALTGKLGFGKDHVRLLTEKPDVQASPATAAEVKRTFAALQAELNADNALFIFLIGHGTWDGKEAKFSLVGPDLAAAEYNTLLSALPTRRIVIFNMASASGEFIKPLTAKGRIVVTSTRNGQEQNATRFAEFFIGALTATDADADQDGHISVFEAFAYASRLTAEFYTRSGRLATEHPLLEDNGDGVGHEKAEGGDGLLARATYLDSLSTAEAAASGAILKLLQERARLEGEIEQLIARKSSLAEPEYEATLEKLFIELAKLNRAIKHGRS